MLKKLALFALCLLPVALAAAQEFGPPTGYKHIPWGTSREMIEETLLPQAKCVWRGAQFNDWACLLQATVGDVDVKVSLSGWSEGSPAGLQGYFMTFNSDHLAKIKGAFEQRFGPAHTSRSEQVKARSGATFSCAVFEWRFPNTTVATIRQCASKIGEGSVYVATMDKVERSARERQKATEKSAKDF